VAALNHPNVVAIHDFGFADGVGYTVCELLSGETLRHRLQRGPLEVAEAVEIAGEIAAGLAAAHERGLVHRDLKPENVFLAPAGAKILDFGLAKHVDELAATQVDVALAETMAAHTAVGTTLGTAGYMSPEQARGLPLDSRSDVFAWGVVLYEMLSGTRAYPAPTFADAVALLLSGEPAPLPPATPPALVRLVKRCLDRSPAARFPSAREAAEALRASDTDVASPPPAGGPSIAVLPFADMSAQRDQDYFCDGLAEELIGALGGVAGLRVAARTSSFRFKGAADLRQVGEELGVGHLLEGSVRKAGDRLRVAVQLVSVADGYRLWSRRFDRRLEDVFEIQDEIAAEVAAALGDVLAGARPAPRAPATRNLEAYDAYLRGRQHFNNKTRQDLHQGVAMMRRAVELDPGYAAAWAGLADCASDLALWWGESEAAEVADRASERALELAPELAEGLAARGVALMIGRRYDEAEAVFERALELQPGSYHATYFYGRMRYEQGRLVEAAPLFERAEQAAPEDFAVPTLLGSLLMALGRSSERRAAMRRAVVKAQRHLEHHPGDVRAIYFLAGNLLGLGEREPALEWARLAESKAAEEPAVQYNLACIFAQANEPQRALDCLETATRGGFGRKEWIRNDPDLEPLRKHPRFIRMFGETTS
jgi:TolB-like protein/Tfp pilus assembly protein PilF